MLPPDAIEPVFPDRGFDNPVRMRVFQSDLIHGRLSRSASGNRAHQSGR